MKHILKITSFLMIMLFVAFISCKDEDPLPANSDFTVLSEYLSSNGMDLPDMLTDWIVGAPTLEDAGTFVTNNYIIDIRSSADFATSHIENAVNSPLGDVLTAASNSGGKPIVVVCYTGQSAGHAVMALRLSGFSNAKVLKFGMSGWNADFSGPWLGNSGDNGNHGVGHAKWNTSATTAPVKFSAPTWTGTGSTGQALLQERVQFMLTEGFKGIANAEVLAAPQNYFINNFWAAADTDYYGHIEGAFRLFPMAIANEDFLNLDPARKIVTYCWTGQTSSMVTAYLTVLGYDATSLKYGVNGMIYSQLEGHKFVLPSVNLPVVNE